MTEYAPAVLASRIHLPGCPWLWTHECQDDFARCRQIDEEAVDMLIAQARRAYTDGLSPRENSNHDGYRQVSHRCPVGDQVLARDNHGFTNKRPMPWTGELYAESDDGRTLFRLYFAERRPVWGPPTTDIIGCGVGTKPVAEDTGWTSDQQTDSILNAMNSAITFCVNTKHVWRKWNTA
ncbi:hypothetical protein [Mycobacterium riyadhense]|uniref:hypothetical protein n=1 Tax=Mycobacterium riyadhense TaxID=486698 RepID=UPI001958A070|nr:hypothetical protein [Mycobacterium riyadhense]